MRKALNIARVIAQDYVLPPAIIRARVVVMIAVVAGVKEVALKHVAMAAEINVVVIVSKDVQNHVSQYVKQIVNLFVAKIVNIVVLEPVLRDALVVARHHVYKVVIMAVETHVVEVVPTVVHLVAVGCCIIVVVSVLNLDHLSNYFSLWKKISLLLLPRIAN